MDDEKSKNFLMALNEALSVIAASKSDDLRVELLAEVKGRMIQVTVQIPDQETIEMMNEKTEVIN